MRKLYELSQSIEIDSTPEECYKLICDFESYPQWFHYVKKATVLKKDELDIPFKAEFICDIIIKEGIQKTGYRLVLDYTYDEINHILNYKVVDGDAKDAEGFYQFRKLFSGKTLATFSIKVSLNLLLPSKIVNFLSDYLMKSVLVMIKNAAGKKS
jgi:ribosome-associated toxin RatA of RatAB toxin-antitoxin module